MKRFIKIREVGVVTGAIIERAVFVFHVMRLKRYIKNDSVRIWMTLFRTKKEKSNFI